MNFDEVCEKFAVLAIDGRIPLFAEDSVDDAKRFIVQFASRFNYSNGGQAGEGFHFMIDPEHFMKSLYIDLVSHTFKWVSDVTEMLKADLEQKTDVKSATFMHGVSIYFMRCQVHNSITKDVLTEPLNYFTKDKQVGYGNPLIGPFNHTFSTVCGGKPLDPWDAGLPEGDDTLVVYSMEGLLINVLRYKGKVFETY